VKARLMRKRAPQSEVRNFVCGNLPLVRLLFCL
jgi:hypothetical protein